MNQEAILWLLGIVQTVMLLAISAGVAWLLVIVQRLTKVETILAMFAERAAAILHSPHTPELDELLEKYCDREYELSEPEWRKLLFMTGEIDKDMTLPKEERVLAAIIHAAASHKLMLPPPKVVKHVLLAIALCLNAGIVLI